MNGSEVAFVALGAAGFLILALSLLLGELFEHEMGGGHEVAFDHHIEVGHGAEGSGAPHAPSWLSLKVVAASMVGFGAVGYVAASTGLPAFVSWPLAGAGFFGVGAGTYFVVLRPLARQQYNSLISRYSYIGRDASVTLAIDAGGTGQVTFHDRQGARVTQTATSDLKEAVARGARVKIVDLAPGGVVVHYNSFSD